MGAQTYELVSGTAKNRFEETKTFTDFLEGFSDEIRASLRTAIAEFLDPTNLQVRAYVLNQLNTHFFLQAGNLSESTVQALLNISGKGRVFKLFLDTNIIFSILGFHNNPSNEAVQTLVSVVRSLSTEIDLRFYVLPNTLDETKRSLDVKKLQFANVNLSPNVAIAAAELEELSGASKKFVEASLKAGRSLTSEEYFGPFLNNLMTILRSHGIELHNDPKLSSYGTLQKVVDDVHENQEFEKSKYGQRAKSYEKSVHDIVLWHFVRDLRPQYLEAPFEAVEWIVTIDYRLMGFDEYKQGPSPYRLPVCLHPSALVQMLQFWVPRTPEFEEALITGFQLPFFLSDFDLDAENVTIQILKTISRYENIENLPKETIGHVVVNDVLREKIKGEKDQHKQIELVRDAIFEVNARLTSELEQSRRKEEVLRREKNELGKLSTQQEEQLQIITGRIAALEGELNAQKEATSEADKRASEILASITDAEKRHARQKASAMVNWITFLAAVAIAVAAYFLIEPVFDNWGWIEPIAYVVSIAASAILVLIGVRVEPLAWRSKLKARLGDWFCRKHNTHQKDAD